MTLVTPPPQVVVVFGASGDLTRRKILPALYNLARQELLPERYAVVGYARTPGDNGAFRAQARAAVEQFSQSPVDEETWMPFAESLSYLAGPFDDPQCFGPLNEHLARIDEERGTEGRRLFYCATPPSAFPVIARRLGECGSQEGNRIVIEKPFGRDLDSARELNRIVRGVFDEPQIFRIDHYLGKETVQNILVFRFANAMFERVWNRDAVDHVEITVAESLGMEGRGPYYEEAGALRDMVQSHLLQVLSFVAMEPPRAVEPEAIRDEKVKLLRTVRPVDPAEVVRGQYTAGIVGGTAVPGYMGEDGVDPHSAVETFVALRAWVDNWRWGGVPFLLRTGKRLPRRATQVTVVFRAAPSYLFEGLGLQMLPSNFLCLRIQPDEGISFCVQAKEPGPGVLPKTVGMDFSYGASFGRTPAEAYERLLHDAMSGDRTLFVRDDGADRAWAVLGPVLETPPPLSYYSAGSWGPEEAHHLVAPGIWHLQ